MRVSFSPGDVRKLKSLFSQDVRFLDVYVTRETLFLISVRTDIYAQKAFPVSTIKDFTEPVAFRVDRKEFLSLASEGIISFYVSSSKEIEITFKTGGDLYFEMVRPFQKSDLSSIESFLDILKQRERFLPLRLSSLLSELSLLKSANSIVEVEDGIGRAKTNSNIRVYMRTLCEPVNLYVATLSYILSNCDYYSKFQNYIVGQGDSVSVIALQDRKGEDADFDWVIGRKHSHRAQADFTSVCALAKRCSTEGLVDLDFDRGVCYFKDDHLRYSTKFKVHEMKSVKEEKKVVDLENFDFDMTSPVVETRKFPRLSFPVILFRDLLSSVERTKVWVIVKRDFILLDVNDKIFFVVGRNEND